MVTRRGIFHKPDKFEANKIARLYNARKLGYNSYEQFAGFWYSLTEGNRQGTSGLNNGYLSSLEIYARLKIS